MMAMSDVRGEARPTSLWAAVLRVALSVVLGHVALFGLARSAILVKVLGDAGLLWGPAHWVTTGRLAMFLLVFASSVAVILWLRPWKAIAAMTGSAPDEDNPETLKIATMSVLLGFMALFGLAAALGLVAGALANPRVERPMGWPAAINIWATFALLVLIGGGGLWGLLRLKPWAKRGPVSPAARKTKTLFGLSGLIAVAAGLPLIFRAASEGNPSALLSSGPLPLWIAAFSIPLWLLSWALGWWWYFSADEHEQRASDVGLLVAGGLFATVTPAWWVAARAGLTPPPDAMILWGVVNLIWVAGWFWRRNR